MFDVRGSIFDVEEKSVLIRVIRGYKFTVRHHVRDRRRITTNNDQILHSHRIVGGNDVVHWFRAIRQGQGSER